MSAVAATLACVPTVAALPQTCHAYVCRRLPRLAVETVGGGRGWYCQSHAEERFRVLAAQAAAAMIRVVPLDAPGA